MLQSRLLTEHVVDSLALQLRLTGPTRVPRSEIFHTVRLAPNATPGEYKLERNGTGFRLTDQTAHIGDVVPGTPVTFRGIELEVSPSALDHSQIEFEVESRDRAVARVQAALNVARRSRESNFVDVRYQDTDPVLVRDVPNALVRRFTSERQTAQQTETSSTAAFLREQIARISAQLRTAEDSLRAFRQARGVISIPDQAATGIRGLSDLRAQRNTLNAERVALGQLLNAQGQPSSTDTGSTSPYRNLVAFPTLLRNPAISNLLGSLATVEDRRAELLSRRSADDPDVQVLTNRIREIEEQLRSLSATYLEGLTNQVAALDATLGQSQQQLDQIPATEIRNAQLQRNAQSLEEMFSVLQVRLKEAEIAEARQDGSIRVVDAAVLPRQPIKPNLLLNMGLALVAGLALGVSAAFVRESADKSLHTRNDVHVLTGAPVLGLIPHIEPPKGRSIPATSPRPGALLSAPGSSSTAGRTALARRAGSGAVSPNAFGLQAENGLHIADAYVRLQTNLAFVISDRGLKTLLITSALPGEGKTTNAVRLALTLARSGKRVLLIDADLRRGRVASHLQLPHKPGLAEVLRGEIELSDALQTVQNGPAELHVLSTGESSDDPAYLLGGDRIHALFDTIAQMFDVTVLDSPPVNAVADAALLAPLCDGVVVVARSGVTTRPALSFCTEQLRNVRAPIVGAILNDIDFRREASYDEAYQHYNYYNAYSAEQPLPTDTGRETLASAPSTGSRKERHGSRKQRKKP